MKTLKHNIKRLFFILSIFFTTFTSVAQAPNKMSYQAVVRNTAGILVANANVGIQISILQTSATGTAVFVERHTAVTNANGLATLEIGEGTLQSGNFVTIDWANGPFFIKTQTDPTGGTNFTISGTSQLLSVPFALFAGASANTWGLNGNVATATSFLGTTNDTDVVFKRNGIVAGRIGRIGLNDNTSYGVESLFSNTSGVFNTAIGSQALLSNTTGITNTANGRFALRSNTSGDANTATGVNALEDNTIGINNTANGRAALIFNTTGSNNTAMGRSALSQVTTGSNNTAIGFDAQVASNTASNQLRLGNTAVTLVTAQVALTTTSDKRWKSNIQTSNLGLDFIKQLRPVFYTRKDVQINEGKTTVLETTSNATTEYGFIAQELENTLNKFDTTNNGIISKDDAGMYGVRYNDLLAPMVKAMQEQQAIIEAQSKTILEITKRLEILEKQIAISK